MQASRSPLGFLGLPAELRNAVYAKALDPNSHSCSPNLLATCRQVWSEARRVLCDNPIDVHVQRGLGVHVRGHCCQSWEIVAGQNSSPMDYTKLDWPSILKKAPNIRVFFEHTAWRETGGSRIVGLENVLYSLCLFLSKQHKVRRFTIEVQRPGYQESDLPSDVDLYPLRLLGSLAELNIVGVSYRTLLPYYDTRSWEQVRRALNLEAMTCWDVVEDYWSRHRSQAAWQQDQVEEEVLVVGYFCATAIDACHHLDRSVLGTQELVTSLRGMLDELPSLPAEHDVSHAVTRLLRGEIDLTAFLQTEQKTWAQRHEEETRAMGPVQRYIHGWRQTFCPAIFDIEKVALLIVVFLTPLIGIKAAQVAGYDIGLRPLDDRKW